MAGLSVDIPSPLEVELPGVDVQNKLRAVEKQREEDDGRRQERVEEVGIARMERTGLIQVDQMFQGEQGLISETGEGAGPVVMRRTKVGVARQTQVEGEPQDRDGKTEVESQGLLKVAETGGSALGDMVQLRLEETSASLAAALEVVEEKINKDDRYKHKKNIIFFKSSFFWWRFYLLKYLPFCLFRFLFLFLFSSIVDNKSTVNILDDIGSMFDDLADQLEAMLD